MPLCLWTGAPAAASCPNLTSRGVLVLGWAPGKSSGRGVCGLRGGQPSAPCGTEPAPGLAALLLAKLRGQSYSPNAGVAFQLQHQHAPNQALFRALAQLPGPWETCAGRAGCSWCP